MNPKCFSPLPLLSLLASAGAVAPSRACEAPPKVRQASADEIEDFVRAQNKSVLTFTGYSAAEYEDPQAMRAIVARILAEHDPAKTIVNSGATAPGIGAAYALAKEKGFTTIGIVSTQARDNDVPLAPCVDFVFYVDDPSWGGRVQGSDELSPTSQALVGASSEIVGIGGGEIARDEMTAARRLGKAVRFFPADMNHEIAREKAAKKDQPAPADFRGAAHRAFAD